ncbi:MAG: UDP-N-acetylmuramoyl-tripeptide--D-alanyl-D-alanine ligase [Phycisphaerales bacterium]|nr:MAG: UDP-N-acetylmuramoyl-tripeptide--D-alanyl-D-alanine ligase [Phycisphaerales bacterium]
MNTPFWTPDRIVSLTGGRWLLAPECGPTGDLSIRGAKIDTREVGPGDAFFAFTGATTDGHRFLPQAAEAGAALAVVDREVEPSGTPTLLVNKTLEALVAMARAWRGELEGTPLIAVTGSAGKTTACRLLDAALGSVLRGSCSAKSHNNLMGVSMTLLNCPRSAEYLVCEVGTNARGEIAELSELARPEIACITKIGRAHLEGLGSVGGVAAEKGSIRAGLCERGGLSERGVLFATADSPELRRVLSGDRRVRWFGLAQDAEHRIEGVRAHAEGVSFELNGERFEVPLLGAHNAINGAAAVLIARELGLDDDQIREGLGRVRPEKMRLQPQRIGRLRLINDAYNANPDSMLAALEVLDSTEAGGDGSKAAVLGDMLEMGPEGPAMHREVVERALRVQGLGVLVLIGPAMAEAAAAVGRGPFAGELLVMPGRGGAEVRRAAEAAADSGLVLLKGSRGLELERVARCLESRAESVGAG